MLLLPCGTARRRPPLGGRRPAPALAARPASRAAAGCTAHVRLPLLGLHLGILSTDQLEQLAVVERACDASVSVKSCNI